MNVGVVGCVKAPARVVDCCEPTIHAFAWPSRPLPPELFLLGSGVPVLLQQPRHD